MKKLIILLFVLTNILAEDKGFMLATLGNNIPKEELDIRDLNNIGTKIIRYPFYGSTASIHFYTENLIKHIEKYPNITFVPDIHWVGCNASSKNTDAAFTKISDNAEIIKQRSCFLAFKYYWNHIVSRTKQYKNVWYDLINEPGPIDIVTRNKYHDKLQEVARMIVALHPSAIIVQPIYGSSCWLPKGFKKLRGVRNLILTCHMYPKKYSDIKLKLDPLVKFVKNNGYMKLYIGEFGSPFNDPNTTKLLWDFNVYANKNNIPYSLHAYREADIWNYEIDPNIFEMIKKFFRE